VTVQVQAPAGRVLVVEDDAAVMRTIRRVLSPDWDTVPASDGQAGVEAFLREDFDVLITDIAMPGMDGLAFSERVRAVSDDIPVILITGNPSVESAMEAVELRAFKYLPKPFHAETLRSTVRDAAQQGRMARMRREALRIAGYHGQPDLGRRTEMVKALDSLWLAYQPIVDGNANIVAYEALVRYDEGDFDDPVALLAAAEELGMAEEVCGRIRALAPVPFMVRPEPMLFVNVDPRQLADLCAIAPNDPLSLMARRVVLELTEHISLRGIAEAEESIAQLKAAGFRLAVDDLGAGYSGLGSFAQIGPDFVKLDRRLVTRVASDLDRQRIVSGINRLCHDLGITVIAEGIETKEDLDTLVALDCDLFQGYLIGRPSPLSWPAGRV
jgi:EAL domain-containing protein (putative c-di-GMP-specific phosphodiesterase class I)